MSVEKFNPYKPEEEDLEITSTKELKEAKIEAGVTTHEGALLNKIVNLPGEKEIVELALEELNEINFRRVSQEEQLRRELYRAPLYNKMKINGNYTGSTKELVGDKYIRIFETDYGTYDVYIEDANVKKELKNEEQEKSEKYTYKDLSPEEAVKVYEHAIKQAIAQRDIKKMADNVKEYQEKVCNEIRSRIKIYRFNTTETVGDIQESLKSKHEEKIKKAIEDYKLNASALDENIAGYKIDVEKAGGFFNSEVIKDVEITCRWHSRNRKYEIFVSPINRKNKDENKHLNEIISDDPREAKKIYEQVVKALKEGKNPHEVFELNK